MAGINGITSDYLLSTGDIRAGFKHNNVENRETPQFGVTDTQGSKSFSDMLSDSIKNVEEVQRTADKMVIDLATGKSKNISETMIAVSKAEIAFQLMTQVRNKAINAYNEIMKMQI
jgi:flagellar hook-basal body complex protein FliE